MKSLFAVALRILTASSPRSGDFSTSVTWSPMPWWARVSGCPGLGGAGRRAGNLCLPQMSGRVAAVSGRATFEIIRERLGPRMAVANLSTSFLINLSTWTAEVGGIALALQLASSVNPKMWIPVAALAVWLVIGRVKFSVMENVTGVVGLCLVMFAVAVFLLGPDWGAAREPDVHSIPGGQRKPGGISVLRDRVVRCGDDSVRGVLLLLRGGGREVDGAGSGEVPAQRSGRISPRRHPLGGHRRAVGDRADAPCSSGCIGQRGSAVAGGRRDSPLASPARR